MLQSQSLTPEGVSVQRCRGHGPHVGAFPCVLIHVEQQTFKHLPAELHSHREDARASVLVSSPAQVHCWPDLHAVATYFQICGI